MGIVWVTEIRNTFIIKDKGELAKAAVLVYTLVFDAKIFCLLC